MNKYLLALGGLLAAGLSTPAFAQNYGDLVIGFSSGSSATNIEVDLGSVNTFAAAGAGVYDLGSLGTDLSAAYGSSWNTSGLDFAIAGVNSTNTTPSFGTYDANYAAGTVFVSKAEATPGVTVTPYTQALASQQTGAISNVSGVLGLSAATEGFATPGASLADLTGHVTALNTTLSAITLSTSALGAWTQAGGNGNFGFASVSAGNFQQVVSSGGSAVEVFDDAPVRNVASTDITGAGGNSYFELLSNGNLEFVVVPEPSTYAAIVGIAVLGYALLRRRQTIAA
jgi:PEP-CTERM motif